MIYLDHNASTPVHQSVRNAMWPYVEKYYGNPSSSHVMGRKEREAVDHAREQVASLLGAKPDEIIFTSSGTESNNHVIKGVAHTLRDRGKHIITSKIEHPAVQNPCRFLEKQGYDVTYVGVDSTGLIDPNDVKNTIRKDTILISIMQANNEVGTIQPIQQISAIAKEAGVWLHSDSAQAIGKIPTRVDELGVDFLSIAGHKCYAPKGIGALYIRNGIDIEPLHHGAAHERGRRGGTEPVPGLVGLGAAAELFKNRLNDSQIQSLRTLRDRLHQGIVDAWGDDAVLLGHPELRLPNTLAIGFKNRVGGELLTACPDICASTGAACHSGKPERSEVLTAMNIPEEVAFGGIRFSLGISTTEDEIEEAIRLLAEIARTGKTKQ